ncbi:MAG TPA: hypothetical protein VFI53_19855 [Myxococcaceae bacterium]|nr:hypothetical protein [Myxococcaceae bacterium]
MRASLRALEIVSLAALWACGGASTPTATSSDQLSTPTVASAGSQGHHHDLNPQAYDPDSRPFGTSMERWSERLWQWIFSVPADHNPMLDLTGADCAVAQPDDKVWFLPSVLDPGGGTVSFTRTCTIPSGRALLLGESAILNDFPCPDPNFKPADGESLYEFLLFGAQGGLDTLITQSLTVDGVKLAHLFDYRETSSDIFLIQGDVSLQTVLDGCITGSKQPAVLDSYTVMLRPLPAGAHTIVYNATDARGTNFTLTYNLTIQ